MVGANEQNKDRKKAAKRLIKLQTSGTPIGEVAKGKTKKNTKRKKKK